MLVRVHMYMCVRVMEGMQQRQKQFPEHNIGSRAGQLQGGVGDRVGCLRAHRVRA